MGSLCPFKFLDNLPTSLLITGLIVYSENLLIPEEILMENCKKQNH